MADRARGHRPVVLLASTGARRLVAYAAAIGIAALVITALVSSGGGGLQDGQSQPGGRALAVTAASPQLLLAERLSLRQLAGQRIVYSYAGLTPPHTLLTLIRRGEAAGVIFFAPNIASLPQLRAVIGELQHANASSPIHAPLMLMTDQEGGLVRRLPGQPALSERAIGQSSDPTVLAAQAGAGAGANLHSLGITVNLAPVLDVYRASGDFIDKYQRSYSSNPAVVARLGGAFITAQQQTGVAATVKHFPGLGAAATVQDTDAGPVTLAQSLGELRAVDEEPYQAAIASGVKLVMVSWAVYSALDPRRPAGLSPSVIHGELRNRLHFHGVTITDALGAGALSGYGNFGARAVLAARGGADLLLCSTAHLDATTLPSGVAALDGIETALAHHHLNRADAEQAAARVIRLRNNP